MKKTVITICFTLLVVFSMGAIRGRYNPVSASDIAEFGTMTATSGNILVNDGTDFESVAPVAYENDCVFYENEIVTY